MASEGSSREACELSTSRRVIPPDCASAGRRGTTGESEAARTNASATFVSRARRVLGLTIRHLGVLPAEAAGRLVIELS